MAVVSSPPLGASISMGLRAAVGEGWLLPVAWLVAVARFFSTVPAVAVGAALALKGAGLASHLRPLSLAAPLEGAAEVMGSARYLAIVGGLWGVGTFLAVALRALFLAGALPTLGARLAGVDATRRFAPGVVGGFPRQMGTLLLSALLELSAAGYLVALAVAAGQLAGAPGRTLPPFLLAAVGGVAFTTGIAGLLASRVLGDLAAARAAVLGEGPASAFAGAVRRFLERPGGLLLAGLSVAIAATVAGAIVQPASGLLASVAERADGLVVVGPQLMLALVSAMAAAALDVGWLSTAAVLACGELDAAPPATRHGRVSA